MHMYIHIVLKTKICIILLCSCTQIKFSGENSCSSYSLSLNHMTFKYTNAKNFSELLNLLQSVRILLRNSKTKDCEFPTGLFLCNTVFVPCNLTTGTPRPFCSSACSNFYSACNVEFNTISGFTKILNYPFMHNCKNTLHPLNIGYGYPNVSSDFEDDCLDLPGR